jgi:formyltetrahydrofolate deformylase
MQTRKAILLFSCPDSKGLVARISAFISDNSGNIISLNEHVDTLEKTFFFRVVWDLENFRIDQSGIEEAFTPLAIELNATWKIHFTGRKLRIAVFVSKYEHCLQELLWRQRLADYPVEIPLIISNHDQVKPMTEYHRIPLHIFPITSENKEKQEQQELDLLSANDIDAVVLARYMQILSPKFIEKYAGRIINIHHSFLPAFMGGNPYKQAFERGVKIIGATSHYVTEDLDEGPIIEQDIVRISHRDTTEDLIRKGRDLERIVLVRAVYFHAEHRVLLNGRKTIVFD